MPGRRNNTSKVTFGINIAGAFVLWAWEICNFSPVPQARLSDAFGAELKSVEAWSSPPILGCRLLRRSNATPETGCNDGLDVRSGSSRTATFGY